MTPGPYNFVSVHTLERTAEYALDVVHSPADAGATVLYSRFSWQIGLGWDFCREFVDTAWIRDQLAQMDGSALKGTDVRIAALGISRAQFAEGVPDSFREYVQGIVDAL